MSMTSPTQKLRQPILHSGKGLQIGGNLFCGENFHRNLAGGIHFH